MADDVENFILQHRLEKPVLLGHSMYVLCPFFQPCLRGLEKATKTEVLTSR